LATIFGSFASTGTVPECKMSIRSLLNLAVSKNLSPSAVSSLTCYSYAHKLRAPVATSPGVASAKKSAAASPSRKPASPARKGSTPLPQSTTKSSSSGSSKPCPASKKAGGGLPEGGSNSPAAGSPRRSSLPKGWRTETRVVNNKEVVTYFSPDGKEFPVRSMRVAQICLGKT
jgi:hypothetical protein